MIGSIIDDIEVVVAKLRLVSDGPPYFMPGHPAEIMQRLGKKTQAAKEKYPLVFLKLDFLEPVNGGMYNYDLNLGIMDFTKQNYTLQQRREFVFNPILIPFYNQFMYGIRTAGKFSWGGEQTIAPHTPVLRPFWGVAVAGNNTKNIFGDPLDCIEIMNLKINKRVTKCI